jgi:hypothetical protein
VVDVERLLLHIARHVANATVLLLLLLLLLHPQGLAQPSVSHCSHACAAGLCSVWWQH